MNSDLVNRLRAWPATSGRGDGLSVEFVGNLMNEAASYIAQPSHTMIAAAQASEAAAELLRIAMDDSYHDVPVVEKLAEALGIAIDLELKRIEECDLEVRTALESLRAECLTYIEGWVA